MILSKNVEFLKIYDLISLMIFSVVTLLMSISNNKKAFEQLFKKKYNSNGQLEFDFEE